jgi:hypothetical protein
MPTKTEWCAWLRWYVVLVSLRGAAGWFETQEGAIFATARRGHFYGERNQRGISSEQELWTQGRIS